MPAIQQMFRTADFFELNFVIEYMKRTIRKYRTEIIGILSGMVAGWCYWYFVGCASGHCPITSSPVNSSAYGALIGLLLSKVLINMPESKRSNK
jgi:tetrahydromethanopterin S-methyltransferase subunit G